MQAPLEEEFKMDDGGEGGVTNRSFADSSTSCFTFLAAYRAVSATAAVSFAAAGTTLANDFGAVLS